MLTYHSIDASGSAISVAPNDFRRHMLWLAENRIRVVPLSTILDQPLDDAIALTFDDAFQNFGEIALPVLAEFELPATLFVVSRRVGGTNSWQGTGGSAGIPTLPLLDWHGVARAAGQGIEIGAHSQTHPMLSLLSPADVTCEVAGSRDDIGRELGAPPQSFCYPYGDVNHEVCMAAADAGYRIAVTTELRPVKAVSDDPRLIPRIDMYYLRERGRLESWGTPAFSRHLAVRRTTRQLRRALTTVFGRWQS